jgi:hypothetical protein
MRANATLLFGRRRGEREAQLPPPAAGAGRPSPLQSPPCRKLILFLAALFAAPAVCCLLLQQRAAVAPTPPAPTAAAVAAAASAAAVLGRLHSRATALVAAAEAADAAMSSAQPTAEELASWAEMRATALDADQGAAPNGEPASAPPPPAVAFLFLTRGELPHARLWEAFFASAGAPSLFRVHVHAPPGRRLNASTVDSALFYDAQLSAPVDVTWGTLSVVDAERRLLAAALADRGVQRFVLLSESCAPLRSFSFVYDYLLSSPSSFLDSFDDVASARYDPAMEARGIPPAAWRKGTQWAALTRSAAAGLVGDERVYAAFQASPSLFAPDEHYKPTVMAVLGLEAASEKRPVTYANWHPPTRSHPKLYVAQEIDSQLITDLQTRREHSRPLEGQHVRCGGPTAAPWLPPGGAREAGAGAPCWLFIRKLTPRAVERLLLEFAPLLGLLPPAEKPPRL